MQPFVYTNGFVALISNKRVGSLIPNALETMSHRAWNGYFLITSDGETFTDPADVESTSSKICIGSCLSEPSSKSSSIILHGQIYSPPTPTFFENLSMAINGKKLDDMVTSLGSVDADYVLAAISDDELIIARDPLGCKPLYIAKDRELVGVASEPKSLTHIGMTNVKHVKPGYLYQISSTRVRSRLVRRPTIRRSKVNMDRASQNVLSNLEASVSRRVHGLKKVSVGFSGGLDSSLLALIASRFVDVRLISVHTSGSRDESVPMEAARILGLDIEQISVSYNDISELAPSLKRLFETNDLRTLSIGLGMYLNARRTHELGLDAILLGQLADELFAGYARYLQHFSNGSDYVERMLLNDVLLSYANNLERDERAVASFTNPILPYTSIDLVDYALSLPIDLKLDLKNQVRKKILREAAVRAGLPHSIAMAPKKAFQYSSGLNKLVLRALRHHMV